MHKIVVGLGFGDETKGATVDWMCAQEDVQAVIRFNGGPQAAHNIVTPDGHVHTFSTFGAGTFQRVPTIYSRHTMFNPFNVWPERTHLMEECDQPDPLDIFAVEWGALLITPYHREKNRIREDRRGGGRYGSTGQGIGETRFLLRKYPYMSPRVSDLSSPYVLRHKLSQIRDLYTTEGFDMSGVLAPDELVQVYMEMMKSIQVVPDGYVEQELDKGTCVFEGAQGVLLDELYGFNPHTTFSKTTQVNARQLLGGRDAECWGASRMYHSRHGFGPFPTENSGVTYDMAPELHNVHGHYQGSWRVGALDFMLLRYAIKVNGGIDKLVVSHMDYLHDKPFEWTDGYLREGKPWLPAGATMAAPEDREESHENGPKMFHVEPLIRGEFRTQEDVSKIFEERVGYRPDMFAYGSTREDRKLVSNLLAVS